VGRLIVESHVFNTSLLLIPFGKGFLGKGFLGKGFLGKRFLGRVG